MANSIPTSMMPHVFRIRAQKSCITVKKTITATLAAEQKCKLFYKKHMWMQYSLRDTN